MKIQYPNFISALILCLSISLNAFSQLPHANFISPNTSGCQPLIVSFIDLSTGSPISWGWDFGDPNSPGTSNTPNPSHVYAIPGTYTVKLTVANANGIDSVTMSDFVTVFQGPTAGYIASNDTICSGDTITLIDTSIQGDTTVSAFLWNLNDGSALQFSSSINHVYNNPGTQIMTFVPMLTVTDLNGCSSSFSNYSVFVLPIADCIGNSVSEASTSENDFYVFPNPATDKIQFNKNISSSKFYNSIGEKVFEINNPGKNHSYDLSGLEPGIYFCKARLDDDSVRITKIIVQ